MSVTRSSIGTVIVASLILAIVGRAAGWISAGSLDLVFLVSFGWGLSCVLAAPVGAARAAWVAVAVGLALLALQQAYPALRYAPYLMIAPVNLVLAVVFARGLLPGRRPVLLDLIDLIGMAPTDDAAFRRFVARQCLLWSVMALGTALLALGGMVLADARAGISVALHLLIGLQVVWFPLSHYYASERYGRPESWWTTLRAMARPGIWSRLGRQP